MEPLSSTSIPRSGRILLSGIPWLARAIDKGRMALSGNLGDYVFPCPMDEEIFRLLSFSEEEFLKTLEENPREEDLLSPLESRIAMLGPRDFIWCEVFLVRHSRLLDEQDREEGHTNSN